MEIELFAEWDEDMHSWYVMLAGKPVRIDYDLMESFNIKSTLRIVKTTCHIKATDVTSEGTTLIIKPIKVEPLTGDTGD